MPGAAYLYAPQEQHSSRAVEMQKTLDERSRRISNSGVACKGGRRREQAASTRSRSKQHADQHSPHSQLTASLLTTIILIFLFLNVLQHLHLPLKSTLAFLLSHPSASSAAPLTRPPRSPPLCRSFTTLHVFHYAFKSTIAQLSL